MPLKVLKVLAAPLGLIGTRLAVRRLAARAAEASAAGDHRAAATLYAEATRRAPRNLGLHARCARALAAAGDLDNAEQHLLLVCRRAVRAKAAYLALAAFYGEFGAPDKAAATYARVLQRHPRSRAALGGQAAIRGSAAATSGLPWLQGWSIDGVVRALLPEARGRHSRSRRGGLHLLRFGNLQEDSHWGTAPAFAGVEAIRGLMISFAAFDTLTVGIDGRTIHEAPVAAHPDAAVRGRYKCVFNAWIDFSAFATGRYELTLAFSGPGTRSATRRRRIVVQPARPSERMSLSDAHMELPGPSEAPVAQRVAALPSVARPAQKPVFDRTGLRILVVRADQLGDFVGSVPAILRLRELFPGANLVGLLSGANGEIGRSTGIFDETILLDFSEDPASRRRALPEEAQRALSAQLHPYAFDIAIDLSENSDTRHLLRLSGAGFLCGFHPEKFSWLDAGLSATTRDPVNRLEARPHAAKVLGLVEWLAASFKSPSAVIPRLPLAAEARIRHGLPPEGPYVVLHTGARLAFSRWPHFAVLQQMILERTAFAVVLFSDGPRPPANPGAAEHSGRLAIVEGQIALDEFDALIAGAAGFVGNDSGPKHLAALRGVPVVSLHCARLNWSEWGQDGGGVILSRRVPCAGCAIHDFPEECGQGIACLTGIRPEEAFDALAGVIAAEGPGGDGR